MNLFLKPQQIQENGTPLDGLSKAIQEAAQKNTYDTKNFGDNGNDGKILANIKKQP